MLSRMTYLGREAAARHVRFCAYSKQHFSYQPAARRGGVVENSYRPLTYPLLSYAASAATGNSLLRNRTNGKHVIVLSAKGVSAR